MAWMAGFYEHLALYVDRGRGAWFSDVDGHQSPLARSSGCGCASGRLPSATN